MTQSKKWVAGVFFLIFAVMLAAGVFSLSRVLKSREALQNSLVTQIEEILDARVELERTRFVFTPFPCLLVTRLKLKFPNRNWPEWTAREARFSFSFFPLLWGRVQVSGFQVRDGEGNALGIPWEKIEFKVKGLGPQKNSPFEWKAKVGGGKGILKGKGRVTFQNPGENFWKGLGIRSEATLHSFSLPEGADSRILKRLPPAFRSDEWLGELRIAKDKSASEVEGDGKFQLKNISSKTSGALSLSGEAQWVWDVEKNTVKLTHLSLLSPFAEVDGAVTIRNETGEIVESRLRGRKVILEELIRNFPTFQSLLPVDTGLSGESEFDLSLVGTWDYLSLHTHWNLTPAVVTYGKIFSKPKDFPMRINFDFLLRAGSVLSGDFSIQLKQATIKGALVKLNLKTGDGEITLLTNKFDLGGWKGLLTPFTGYRVTGSAKGLLNSKGNLLQLGTSEKMLNVTLDDVTILSPTGKGLRRAKAHIDVSSLSVRVDNSRFGLGNSSLQMEAEIYSLEKNPQGTIEISSPHLDPFEVLENLKEFRPLLQRKFHRWDAVEETLNRFFPQPSLLEDFSLHLKIQEHKALLQNLEFEAWGGKFGFEGEWNGSGEKPSFWLGFHLENVSLVRYFEGFGNKNGILEGNLFFTGKFQGKGAHEEEILPTLSGEGNLSVTNGEWPSLDIAGPLKNLVPLRNLTPSRVRSLPFSDLKANWKFKEGKFDTGDLILNTEDYWIEGRGNLSVKGVLNSRLEVYLSKYLTEQALKSWQATEEAEGRKLGPIPLLLVGNVTRPEPRIDGQRAESFLEAVRARKFRRVLRKPFVPT